MGFLIIAVRDTDKAVRGVLGDSPSLPVLADKSGHIASLYGVDTLPTNVFITATGRIGKMAVGPTTAAKLASAVAAIQ